jgi:hypothetical protein
MPRGEAAHWICENRNCGKTTACDEVEREPETRACVCGSSMKKAARAAVFGYLNFLRETGSSETEKKEEEETPCDTSMWIEAPRGERLRWS